MMNMSGPEKAIEQTEINRSAVICAKCKHPNPHGQTVCEQCGAHLHVVCHRCGRRNERVQEKCIECGHSLHRSKRRRRTHKLFGKSSNISTVQIVLLLLGIIVIVAITIYLLIKFKYL